MTRVSQACGLLMLIGVLSTPMASRAADVLVLWDPVTTNADGSAISDLSHYHLWVGTEPGVYGAAIPTGLETHAMVPNVAPGTTLHLTVTAVDTSGNESTHAVPVAYTVPLPPLDTLPPTITTSSVQPDAVNVDPSSTLTVQFSESMMGSSINVNTVRLTDAQGALVQASISYNSTTQTVTLDPTVSLAPLTTYTLTLAGMTDEAGNLLAPVVLSFTTDAAPPLPVLDPIASYRFDEGSGNRLFDVSGHAFHGTLRNGPTWGPGAYVGGLRFDGVNDYVSIPNRPALNIAGTQLTISLWANITDISRDMVLLAKPWSNAAMRSPYYQYGIEFDGNGLKTIDFYFGDTANGSRSVSMSGVHPGVWTHIAFTYDGARLKGYRDGALSVDVAETRRIKARGHELRLGVDASKGQAFAGSLDQVRIYARALSAQEIQQDRETPL